MDREKSNPVWTMSLIKDITGRIESLRNQPSVDLMGSAACLLNQRIQGTIDVMHYLNVNELIIGDLYLLKLRTDDIVVTANKALGINTKKEVLTK